MPIFSDNQLQFSSVQSLSHIRLFVAPRTTALQASLSITNSRSPLKLTSIESVMPTISSSIVPFSSCLQSFPASGSFQMSQFFESAGQSIGVSASASVLINIQDWSLLGWTAWISLQSKELSRVLQHHSSKISILWHSAFLTPSEFRIDDTRNVENQSRVEKCREMKLIERLYFSTHSEIILATLLVLLH